MLLPRSAIAVLMEFASEERIERHANLRRATGVCVEDPILCNTTLPDGSIRNDGCRF
ncbi:MAG: hypothetical protein MUC60_17630 [Oscillatoria sp. Prado101]|nr:hypothetical protein [Oscillatoria sp. Prado101]